MKVILCVCTRNRPDELKRNLESVKKAILKPDLILISDDSEKKFFKMNKKIAENFCRKGLNIRHIRGPRMGLGANRNNCLKYISFSKNTFIHFLDDDAQIKPDFYPKILQEFKKQKKIVVTGKEIRNGFTIEPSRINFLGYFKEKDANFFKETFIVNATLFPVEIFKKIKFDKNLKYGADEMDLAFKIKKLGYKIIYQQEAVVIHNHSQKGREEYKKYTWFSRNYVMLKRYGIYQKNILKLSGFLIINFVRSVLKVKVFEFFLAIKYFLKNRKREEV